MYILVINYYRPRYPSRSILCLCPIFIIYHYLPPFELPTLSQKLALASLSNFLDILKFQWDTLSQKLALASLSNFLDILRTSVRSSDRNFSGI